MDARVAKGTATDELTDGLDFLIRDTRLLLTSQIEELVAEQGLPLRIWFPLRALYRKEGITQRELGRMLGFGDAHAGVIVRVMQRLKLVRRQKSQVDRRRIDLFLTDTGRKAAQETLRQMRAINERIVDGFSATEVEMFRSLLLRAHANLKTS
jgi:DNA-binding MarR family transcriptional regulator